MSSRSQSRWLPRWSACAWDLDRDCFARLAAASLGSWVGLGLGCWLIWGSPVEEYLGAYCVCVWHCRPVHLGGRWRIGVLTGGYMARVNETGQQRRRVKFDPCNKVSVMRGNLVVVWIVTCLEARWKRGCYGHSFWGGGPCWRKGRGSAWENLLVGGFFFFFRCSFPLMFLWLRLLCGGFHDQWVCRSRPRLTRDSPVTLAHLDAHLEMARAFLHLHLPRISRMAAKRRGKRCRLTHNDTNLVNEPLQTSH